ncbi:unnamed protein product [Allacma fusca]|uniref:Uncharacterized protein n=1 Tax=Allacma fusca TaxID=39272 RepID=A0A8J2KQL5_9HEXA|nr:unnamed protein product [Allacma fusca]
MKTCSLHVITPLVIITVFSFGVNLQPVFSDEMEKNEVANKVHDHSSENVPSKEQIREEFTKSMDDGSKETPINHCSAPLTTTRTLRVVKGRYQSAPQGTPLTRSPSWRIYLPATKEMNQKER